jgi:N-acetylglutamate synthase-like GNAT family acetyltransferase
MPGANNRTDRDALKIREARKADRRAIKALVRRARLNPFGIDWRRFCVCVTENGKVIGIGQLKKHISSFELASIAVARKWRRQGAAGMVIKHLLGERDGEVWLQCRSNLVPFYNRFGFLEVRKRSGVPIHFRSSLWMSQLIRLMAPDADYIAAMIHKKGGTSS